MPLSRRRHAARNWPVSLIATLAAVSLVLSRASAITFNPAPSANLDLSQLGRAALVGDFSGISLFQYEAQNELPYNTNGSESLLAQMPNGAYASIVTTDASIRTMCNFTLRDGSYGGVVVGGNFTSLGGQQSTAIALFDPSTSTVTRVAGLSGSVNAVLCDQETNSVYVGGSFIGVNSTNALAWVGREGWKNLPFAGFNGPVMSITKAPNGNIIFGGTFTGLGNASTPSKADSHVINLLSANITSASSSSTTGFSDPRNIICKSSGTSGPGNTWLLQDRSNGFWDAAFGYGFRPTKLRLYNTNQDGRGTKTWRLTALPIHGIMNFTYIDPTTGANASCTSECPLSNNASLTYEDFYFVNVIGMNQIRIDISDYYGNGAGLNGIELFSDDIFSYAINDFNGAACAGSPVTSSATATGPWRVTPSFSSISQYLTAELSGPITESQASVVFTPHIRESGRYSVNLYTPGCLQDKTCESRGQFVISGRMTARESESFRTTLYQTNDFDKYDTIYFGDVDATSSSFKPQITMTPLAGQALPTMRFVAQRIGIVPINSTGGLNGLYEYEPSSTGSSDLSSSAFNRLGMEFTMGSAVNAMTTSGGLTFIGGNFTSSSVRNVVALRGNDAQVQTLDGGLNGEVVSMLGNGTNLFVGGKFSNTLDNSHPGLRNVAVYDSVNNRWNAMGGGVNGRVDKVVGVTMNITGPHPEFVVGVSGAFDQLEEFSNNPAVTANGFALWVPSQSNWLQNLNLPVSSINGLMTTSILAGEHSLYAGSVSSSTLTATGAASLAESLGRLPIRILSPPSTPSTGGTGRRESVSQTPRSGVVTGTFDTNNHRNLTILAGHFTARSSSGSVIHNLLIMDRDNRSVGLGSAITAQSTFLALAIAGNDLFAGGTVTGNINGSDVNNLISYNLDNGSFNRQPPGLTGNNASVSSITVRSGTNDVYVGGSFTSAGSLGCPGLCVYNTESGQWNQPGSFGGTVDALFWPSASTLVVGGNLTVNETAVTNLATYNPQTQIWDTYPGASQLPGPVRIITAATGDGSQLWISGLSSNGSAYLMRHDGTSWHSAGALGAGTEIHGLQVFSLLEDHGYSPLLSRNEALLVTGSINMSSFGTASAVIYNGRDYVPFALTQQPGNRHGTIAQVFVEKQNFFNSSTNHLPVGFIVLIGLGISLILMLLLVVAGMLLDKLRKKREGYVPAPTSMYDRGTGMQKLPPHELLDNLTKGRSGAPYV